MGKPIALLQHISTTTTELNPQAMSEFFLILGGFSGCLEQTDAVLTEIYNQCLGYAQYLNITPTHTLILQFREFREKFAVFQANSMRRQDNFTINEVITFYKKAAPFYNDGLYHLAQSKNNCKFIIDSLFQLRLLPVLTQVDSSSKQIEQILGYARKLRERLDKMQEHIEKPLHEMVLKFIEQVNEGITQLNVLIAKYNDQPSLESLYQLYTAYKSVMSGLPISLFGGSNSVPEAYIKLFHDQLFHLFQSEFAVWQVPTLNESVIQSALRKETISVDPKSLVTIVANMEPQALDDTIESGFSGWNGSINKLPQSSWHKKQYNYCAKAVQSDDQHAYLLTVDRFIHSRNVSQEPCRGTTQAAEMQLRAEPRMQDVIIPIMVERQSSYFYKFDESHYRRILRISEYWHDRDLEHLICHKDSKVSLDTLAADALSIYGQMASIFDRIGSGGYALIDARNLNWAWEGGELKLGEVRSLVFTNEQGQIDFEHPKNYWQRIEHLPRGYVPDFSLCDKPLVDKWHAYSLGKNMYQFLTGIPYTKLDNFKKNRDYSHPVFQTKTGMLFKELIEGLMQENPEQRLSLKAVLTKLKSPSLRYITPLPVLPLVTPGQEFTGYVNEGIHALNRLIEQYNLKSSVAKLYEIFLKRKSIMNEASCYTPQNIPKEYMNLYGLFNILQEEFVYWKVPSLNETLIKEVLQGNKVSTDPSSLVEIIANMPFQDVQGFVEAIKEMIKTSDLYRLSAGNNVDDEAAMKYRVFVHRYGISLLSNGINRSFKFKESTSYALVLKVVEQGTEVYLRSQKDLEDIFTPNIVQREFYRSSVGALQQCPSLLISEFHNEVDLEAQILERRSLGNIYPDISFETWIEDALSLYMQMASILERVHAHGCTIVDMRNAHWVAEQNELKLGNSNIFIFAQKEKVLKQEDLLNCRGGTVSELELKECPQLTLSSAEQRSAYFLGKNLYEYLTLTDYQDAASFSRNELSFSSDLFKVKKGILLKNLIRDLTHQEPEKRLLVSDALARLILIQQGLVPLRIKPLAPFKPLSQMAQEEAFAAQVNQGIETLNQFIDQYNLEPAQELLYQMNLERASVLNNLPQYGIDGFTLPQQYLQLFCNDLFSILQNELNSFGVDTWTAIPKDRGRMSEHWAVTEMIINLPPEDLDEFMQFINNFIRSCIGDDEENDNKVYQLKNLGHFDSSDVLIKAIFQDFLAHYSIQFLSGGEGRNQNIAFISKDHHVVLRVDDRAQATRSAEIYLRSQENMQNDLVSVRAERHYADGHACNTVLIMDLYPEGDLQDKILKNKKRYMNGDLSLEELIQEALFIYVQMAEILQRIEAHGCAFIDMKNPNWFLDGNKLKIGDNKSIVFTNEGKVDWNYSKNYWNKPIYTDNFWEPPGSVFDSHAANKRHAYMLGRNLYQMLSCMDPDEVDLSFSHPVFKTEKGMRLQALIQNLTVDDPEHRMSTRAALGALRNLQKQDAEDVMVEDTVSVNSSLKQYIKPLPAVNLRGSQEERAFIEQENQGITELNQLIVLYNKEPSLHTLYPLFLKRKSIMNQLSLFPSIHEDESYSYAQESYIQLFHKELFKAIQDEFTYWGVASLNESIIESALRDEVLSEDKDSLVDIVSNMKPELINEFMDLIHKFLGGKEYALPQEYQAYELFFKRCEIEAIGVKKQYKCLDRQTQEELVLRVEEEKWWGAEAYLRSQEDTQEFFVPVLAERQCSSRNMEPQKCYTLVVMQSYPREWCIDRQRTNNLSADELIERALLIYTQMAAIFERIGAHGCTFLYTPNFHWMMEGDKLKLCESKFLVFPHQEVLHCDDELTYKKALQSPQPKSIYLDQRHAYLLGRNLYQFLSGYSFGQILKFGQKNFEAPIFKTEDGLLLKELLIDLMQTNSAKRPSMEETSERLKEIQNMRFMRKEGSEPKGANPSMD